MASDSVTFPRQYARTQRFTLGAPRACVPSPDGQRVVFLRSGSGTDRSHALWTLDLTTGRERCLADPADLLEGDAEELPPEERARRERSRESSAGIVEYATDTEVTVAAYALSGQLFVTELATGHTRRLPVPGPVVDPRPSPDGRHVAYVTAGALRVVGVDGSGDRALVEPDRPEVTFGLAEFVAAEEMERHHGYWWSPDSTRLLVARVDTAPVHRWWIADPARPEQPPTEVRYPAAGTPNADVTLHLVDLAGGTPRPVDWDRADHPYLARVHWSAAGPPLLLVQRRDQRHQRYLTVDPATGRTVTVREETDPHWLELHPGVPSWTPDGRLVRIADVAGARVLLVGDQVLTDDRLHLRAVLDVGERDVLVSASPGEGSGRREPGHVAVVRVPYPPRPADGGEPSAATAGTTPATTPAWQFLSPAWDGVATAVRRGHTAVLSHATLRRPGREYTVLRLPDGEGEAVHVATLASRAETPVLTARPRLGHTGAAGIPTAVLLPSGYRPEQGPLPVLLDPYGGPHAQRVVAAHNPHLVSQWFAEQGFAVVVADGRGTPGYSPQWEKAIHHRVAEVVLEDQVTALHALAREHPLDLNRVAIRGWSFGGLLAGLAVLRRPDVFHAAVVGAPVTDWRLYDSHYTERYLGHPEQHPKVYRANSLVDDEGLVDAVRPHRPVLLVHGLADDNVVVAHSLRLSTALLAEGRPHEVLPLSGVTHMASQEQVSQNLLLLQLEFLRRALGLGTP